MTLEGTLMRLVMRDCSRGDVRLLRNQVGFGLHVPKEKIGMAIAVLAEYGIDARPLKYGVGNPGGADLLGVRTLTILPHHVGHRIGQAVALEVKTPSGRVSEDQRRFVHAARHMGCVAAVVRSVAEAVGALEAELVS